MACPDIRIQLFGDFARILPASDPGYLLRNLITSYLQAVFLISLLPVSLFMSALYILFVIFYRIIAPGFTAGQVGLSSVYIKTSTITVSRISRSIASDQYIYFLTGFYQEMRKNPVLSIFIAVTLTLHVTVAGLVYTADILFSGFFIFSGSNFGRTTATVKLLPATLPSFHVSPERRLASKAFFSASLLVNHREEEDKEPANQKVPDNERSYKS